MFGRKTKSGNDKFLMSVNAKHDKKSGMGVAVRNEPRPPMKREKITKPQTNLHPASPRQKLGALGIPKNHIK